MFVNTTGNGPFSQLDNHPALRQFPKFRQLAQYFMEQSVSYRTHKSYTSSVKQYLDFCVMCRCPPFPVTELNLIYYCCFRIHKVKKKTVFRDLYAIKKHAGYYGFQVDFMRMYNLNQVKLGMSKCFGEHPPNKRLPISLIILFQIADIIDWNDYNQVMLFCMLVVGVFGLLRTSEFTAENQKVKYRDIKSNPFAYKALWVENLSAKLNDDQSVDYYRLLIRASKTDVFRSTVKIILGKGKPPVCPVYLLTKMINMRAKLAETNPALKWEYYMPLFCAQNGKIVTRNNLTKFLNTVLKILKIDCSNFSIYSCRIGGATMYARRGFNDYDIQMLGRWQSAAYKTYIRKSETDLAAMSSRMVNAPVSKPNAVFMFQEVAEQDLLTVKV